MGNFLQVIALMAAPCGILASIGYLNRRADRRLVLGMQQRRTGLVGARVSAPNRPAGRV